MVTYFLTFLKHGFPASSLFLTPAPEWLNYLIYNPNSREIARDFFNRAIFLQLIP